jgi:hypothetical protein
VRNNGVRRLPQRRVLDLARYRWSDRRTRIVTLPSGLGLAEGMALSRLTFEDLWLLQVSVGGTAGQLEVEAYVLGMLNPDEHSHDVIAQAMNEHFLDEGQAYPVSYWSATATTAP